MTVPNNNKNTNGDHDGPASPLDHAQLQLGMVKEAYALQASLSVLLDARKHIADYPTQAADAGSGERTARHFLQRVLNSTTAELAPTQAAAQPLVPAF